MQRTATRTDDKHEHRTMKLTQRDARILEQILADLQRGQAFLMRPDILVCRRRTVATTTDDFTNAHGEVCVSIDKEIGSDLTILHTGIARLKHLLTYTS